MQTDLRNTKCPRASGNTSETDANQDLEMEIPETDQAETLPPPPTYASKAMSIAKPRDVRVDKEKNSDERAKMTVLEPTPEFPFKQIEFTADLKKLMAGPWINSIMIKVLGKPWYYPTLLSKL